MPRLTLALAVALCPTVALACGPTPPAFDGDPSTGVSVSVGRITDRTWEPVTIAGVTVPEDAGLSLPFECRAGVCGQCKVRLRSGAVSMDAEDALTPAEKRAGFVLACQAHALGDLVVEA